MPSLWKPGAVAGRAKPGHKSIRGTISAPIPIPSVLDDDEFPIRNPGSAKAMTTIDDEFPMRNPGTGIATAVPPTEPDSEPEAAVTLLEPKYEQQEQQHELPIENADMNSGEHEKEQDLLQVPASTGTSAAGAPDRGRTDVTQDIQPEAPTNPPPAPPSGSGASIGRSASRTPPQIGPPQRASPQRASPPRTSPFRARTSPSVARSTNPPLSTIRYSTISDAPSGQRNQSKDSPTRKKSTLRSALGRLFGRKKKNSTSSQDSGATSGRESGLMGSSQHRSDPTALGRSKERSPKRSTSLPLTEYDRPLRSHSIGPDDILAINSARNSLQAEARGSNTAIGPGGRRRAATTTSRLLLQPRMRNPEWGAGLSPRPASTHGRGSRLIAPGEFEDPNEIGRAITSDSGNGARRRSRSLSGLQDLVGAQTSGRRRSDEIRFWRESYNPGLMSPLSSNAPEDDTVMLDASVPPSPAVERRPNTPPQPFNFGNITNDMVGMKITQAASIDIRIGTLESRTNKLERVVDQLCHIVPGFKVPLSETAAGFGDHATSLGVTTTSLVIPSLSKPISIDPKEPPRPPSSHHSAESDSQSQISFGEAPTFIGSLHPPSSSATQPQSLTATAPAALDPLPSPISNSTVRGTTSLPSMGRDVSGSDDPYAALVAQLAEERAARQALEAQVKKLSERLNALSTTMFAMIRGPSESRSQERLTSSAGGNSPLLQPPKTLFVPPSAQIPKPLSGFETDDEEESEVVKSTPHKPKAVDDEDIAEDFQTPLEDLQPPHNYGAFGEELRPDDEEEGEDDPKRKKAARTLSLSQLTLKKGLHTHI
ncbi:hypothetical protein B0H67DRAFT_654450 [Lasiosphaeris hirsuta]|uniref:Uncharacterized protein n=1 Tax=Lasiosphaeris hirsuta TaxID=260670 RepID=A0AA40EBT8_9PEZI|nr:hypothetical protein B0H67DRAFT_654450 [Lasiosphaeris hirsuta]